MTAIDEPDKSDSIYLRSIATRSTSGSVPYIVKDLAKHLLGAGFNPVIVETVGAGQAEIRCAAMADRLILVEGPGRGDGVQAEKAGLLELADLVIINKSDLPGAEKVFNEISVSLSLDEQPPPILKVSALNGDGVDSLADILDVIPRRSTSMRARAREQLLIANERRLFEKIDVEKAIAEILTGVDADDILEGR